MATERLRAVPFTAGSVRPTQPASFRGPVAVGGRLGEAVSSDHHLASADSPSQGDTNTDLVQLGSDDDRPSRFRRVQQHPTHQAPATRRAADWGLRHRWDGEFGWLNYSARATLSAVRPRGGRCRTRRLAGHSVPGAREGEPTKGRRKSLCPLETAGSRTHCPGGMLR
jgi:hypothetical protein